MDYGVAIGISMPVGRPQVDLGVSGDWAMWLLLLGIGLSTLGTLIIILAAAAYDSSTRPSQDPLLDPSNPANPASPLSPANPANPASPLNMSHSS